MKTAALITANTDALLQAQQILESLTDSVYAQTAPGTDGISIGAHMRHVLEFYECFLHGVNCGVIDYDSRTRSVAVQTERRTALKRTEDTRSQLSRLPAARTDSAVQVCSDSSGILLHSTIGRELAALLSHTIHHFAMIAVALHIWGVPVDPTFGVAPATLRYRALTAEAA